MKSDTADRTRVDAGLTRYAARRPLPGIQASAARAALLFQVVESIRRVRYVSVLAEMPVHVSRRDPTNSNFDPIRAAILAMREGEIDEAFWFVFLFVHFGKHRRDGWQLLRRVYAGTDLQWTWAAVSTDPQRFRQWLQDAVPRWKAAGLPTRFGNHRKYQSLDALSPTGTGAAVASYVQWVGPSHIHLEVVTNLQDPQNPGPKSTFENLYTSMDAVTSFGRTAKFDYLTMLGKLKLAPIEAPRAYLTDATGPKSGARLLFTNDTDSNVPVDSLELWLAELDSELQVGMQVLEDSLCNWQKSPSLPTPFRG